MPLLSYGQSEARSMFEIRPLEAHPVFGQHRVCAKCGGRGGYDYDKKQRRRELKQAKDTGQIAPPITYLPCVHCHGRGVVDG